MRAHISGRRQEWTGIARWESLVSGRHQSVWGSLSRRQKVGHICSISRSDCSQQPAPVAVVESGCGKRWSSVGFTYWEMSKMYRKCSVGDIRRVCRGHSVRGIGGVYVTGDRQKVRHTCRMQVRLLVTDFSFKSKEYLHRTGSDNRKGKGNSCSILHLQMRA